MYTPKITLFAFFLASALHIESSLNNSIARTKYRYSEDHNDRIKNLEAMFLSGNIEKMNQAYQQGVNIHCRDHFGNTALHLAAFRRDYDQIKPLMQLSLNPHTPNNDKISCVDILRKNQENGVINLHKLQDPTEKQKLHESKKTIVDILHESMVLNNHAKIDSPREQSKRKIKNI